MLLDNNDEANMHNKQAYRYLHLAACIIHALYTMYKHAMNEYSWKSMFRWF